MVAAVLGVLALLPLVTFLLVDRLTGGRTIVAIVGAGGAVIGGSAGLILRLFRQS